jgi:hypothetical protein
MGNSLKIKQEKDYYSIGNGGLVIGRLVIGYWLLVIGLSDCDNQQLITNLPVTNNQ